MGFITMNFTTIWENTPWKISMKPENTPLEKENSGSNSLIFGCVLFFFFHPHLVESQIPGITLNTSIIACESRHWQKAFMIFERLQVQGIGHDIMSFNSTISTCQVDGKNWQQSLLMFQSLNEVDMDPNLITCNAVLSGCGKKAGEWHQALVLFESIPTIRVERDVISYNAQIASVQGAWKESLILFGQMSEKLMEPNIITYSTSISLYEKGC